jgi:hypothetical protein
VRSGGLFHVGLRSAALPTARRVPEAMPAILRMSAKWSASWESFSSGWRFFQFAESGDGCFAPFYVLQRFHLRFCNDAEFRRASGEGVASPGDFPVSCTSWKRSVRPCLQPQEPTPQMPTLDWIAMNDGNRNGK